MRIFAIAAESPPEWLQLGSAYSFIALNSDKVTVEQLVDLFGDQLQASIPPENRFLIRHYLPGVSNPVAESLARVLKIPSSEIRIDRALTLTAELSEPDRLRMESLWKEPAIERLMIANFLDYQTWVENLRVTPRSDDSLSKVSPEEIGLDFSSAERKVLAEREQAQDRRWNRAEWELFAQTWSEHCKHKIFNAQINLTKEKIKTNSLFKTKLRAPALKCAEARPELFLSLFHDNAGVIRIYDPEGKPTEWALAAKMETHNSPSAISPYGGASTGIVGVHRDILGTGLGALPIANWNVLCFESVEKAAERPASALDPEIIRKGVLRGIQDGGNQSGIPTVQGSVVFDSSYAVKPLVYAGALGLLPVKFVNKAAAAHDRLFVIGGATGADGLRGAVMSSRDIRADDFSGSIVQVANPYTQRCVTDFLMEARDLNLLSAVTDNGAGGLASSVGEMATLTGGATIDLTHLRLKFAGLLEWEKLLSESQERMTLATRKPGELKKLLEDWRVEYDELGELNSSGNFVVTSAGQTVVNVPLTDLHDLCPQLQLESHWTWADEQRAGVPEDVPPPVETSLAQLLQTPAASSREQICRRFDHEVQGRTLRKPFAGRTQASPQNGSLLEVFEAQSYVALGHGLAPTERNFLLSILLSFDEAMKGYLLATGRLEFAGLLDNFCWPDPLNNARSLWKLEAACDLLALITEVTRIPFISGKDSMKNNDREFRIKETLVISAFGSARGPGYAPAAFFLEDEQTVYNWKPICFEALSAAKNYGEALEGCRATLEQLLARYKKIEQWVSEKKLIAAKDYSSSGPLKSIFEMSLGREIGMTFELQRTYAELTQVTGSLGAFHLVFAENVDVLALGESLEKLGTTRKEFSFDFNARNFDLQSLRAAYQKLGADEGLWA